MDLFYASQKIREHCTGATNEPWHFRYVGKEAAKEIHDKGWILEDYIEHHGFAYNLRLN